MHRIFVVAVVAGCSSASSPRPPSLDPSCDAVARHVMRIGPVDRWIAEAREEEMLPVDGASDRDALEKMFQLACRDNWVAAQRACVIHQPSWNDVERECQDAKVWWYEPT